MNWLRYTLDRIMARFEAYCPYDWTDHDCPRCDRVARRNVRIASYRAAKRLPKARVKVIVP